MENNKNMKIYKCENSFLRVQNGNKLIMCKERNNVCLFQRYCNERKEYVLSESSQKCIKNK
jgi:hypothetical protein